VTAPALDPAPGGELVTFDVSRADSWAAVRAAGEIDSTTAPLLSQHLTELLDAEVREIIVDLRGVTFLDSAGLCVLATMHRRAVRQDVRTRVLAGSRAVVRPLQITGLWDLLHAEQISDADQVA
jgi:anti-sigma B factor antagonist